ncbi:MAG: methyltransferase [Actinomycetota bacterium]|nr:methyltransferase [Actinomycetota bacterium]
MSAHGNDDGGLGPAVLQLVSGYQEPAALVAACRIGLFDALADDPADADALAAGLAVDAGGLRSLLDTLVVAGLVARGPAGYSAAAEVRARLGREGDLTRIVHKESVFARVWLDLDETLRTGTPRMAPWAHRLASEPDVARSFLEALCVIAETMGPDLTGLPLFAPPVRVVDVGGGLGTHARPLAAAGAAVTLVDLPPVAGWAADAAAGWGLPPDVPPVEVVGADVVADRSCGVEPGSADVVLVSHVVHDLVDTEARTVLTQAAVAARPGGRVVVVEIPGDAGPVAVGPLFGLMMRVETPGRARPVAELVELMAAAGLTAIERAPYADPVAVLVGIKP